MLVIDLHLDRSKNKPSHFETVKKVFVFIGLKT